MDFFSKETFFVGLIIAALADLMLCLAGAAFVFRKWRKRAENHEQ